MNRTLKYILLTLGSLVLLAIIGANILVFFVNPNNFKAPISKQIEERTGRTLVINGDINWTFFPWLGIQMHQLQLSNAPGFGEKPFAKIEELDFRVRLLPLLIGHIEMGNVALNGLDLSLIKNAQGIGNWQNLLKSATNSSNAVTAPEEKSQF